MRRVKKLPRHKKPLKPAKSVEPLIGGTGFTLRKPSTRRKAPYRVI